MQTLENLKDSATAEGLADADITAAIELFFLTKKGVTSHLIAVKTKEGIVELTGQTDSLLSRDRAEEIALAVRGVQAVINELEVNTAPVPDDKLQLDVTRALTDNAVGRDYNLRCTVKQGVVTLTGTVPGWAEKQLALRLVRGVKGVRRVLDEHLQVCWGERLRSDVEITDQIREALDWDIRVQPRLVRVRTNDRVVHLEGTVGSASEKARITSIAYQAGATRVDARDLFVAAWAQEATIRREKFVMRPDEEIAKTVRDTLRRDPRTHAFYPLVQVRDGIVTLAGNMGSLLAQEAAEQDARHVVGVWNVYNLLKVRPELVWADSEIRQSITEALARDPYLEHHDFTVNVLDGKAYLYGRVANYFEQEHARSLASGINGVTAVENHLTIPAPHDAAQSLLNPLGTSPVNPPTDHDLAERIRTRYFWSSSLHDQDIEVQVAHGRVNLVGNVDTWVERKQAAREAYEAGAREVNNHLCTVECQGACD